MLVPIQIRGLVPVLADLGLEPAQVRLADAPQPPEGASPRALLCALAAEARDPAQAASELAPLLAATTGASDHLLVVLLGARDELELARWRDALWPSHHLGALYDLGQRGLTQRTLQGSRRISGGWGHQGTMLVARPRAAVFAADAVAAKFDQNAGGWNATPGSRGYAHFRWMRRFVGTFAFGAAIEPGAPGAPASDARRILDFGCGAGWVGIEAALRAPRAELCAFDPSSEMVRHAQTNALASGVTRFQARVGFGEEPPFPAADEAPFDLVLSSGVISFSGERERFEEGLLRALAPGGTLVIGDINPESKGMRRRRRERALLPLRELNAPARERVRGELEARGLVLQRWSGYQLTSPMPELMHWSGRRLAGWLDRPLLWWNERSVGTREPERFDSWVMQFTRPA